MKIAIVGLGYVGMSLSVLLGRKYKIYALDNDEHRVTLVNKLKSTVSDEKITDVLNNEKTNIIGTLSKKTAYQDASYIIICAPTDFDEDNNKFDLSIIDSILSDILHHNKEALIIIKSTLPIGATKKFRQKYDYEDIIFSPEFLREGKALEDNLNPSRIIIGSDSSRAKAFGEILRDSSNKKSNNLLFMGSTEAEAVKLFSNTYLAMRVSFFNELDTFSYMKGLNTESIIEGMSYDERIGSHYNNPSFGYGGYCLPKDTKGLLKDYDGVPQSIINSIVESNLIRKNFISKIIEKKSVKNLGIYKISMKYNSDNYRSSAIIDIISSLSSKIPNIIIFEPSLNVDSIFGHKIEKDLNKFKNISDLIVCNRFEEDLEDVKEKIFTRDIFKID